MPSHRILTAALLACVGVTPLVAQAQRSLEISVDDARPLLAALGELEKRLGWVVTYEDPPWAAPADLQDRTALTGKPYDPQKPQLIPRGGRFKFSGTPRDNSAAARADLVQALLQDYHLSDVQHGQFKLLETPDVIHVVPAQFRNAQGQLETRASIMDTPVRLTAGTRPALDVAKEITDAVSSATGMKVEIFFVPTNLFWQTKVTVSEPATDETARVAMLRVLAATGRKLSWSIAYLPDVFHGYAMSIHVVP